MKLEFLLYALDFVRVDGIEEKYLIFRFYV